MDGSGISANSCAALLAHSKHNDQWTPSPHAYLISSTLSATSIHIDEGKRTRHESRYVAYKNKKQKNHDLVCCDKEEEQNKSGEIQARRFYFPS